jgi:hypothetical protein
MNTCPFFPVLMTSSNHQMGGH